MLPPIIDTHCHLDFETFGKDFDDVLARAADAGVVQIVTIGSGRDVASAAAAVELASKMYPRVASTVGVHPHDARVVDDTVIDGMETLARDPHVKAIGEIGLDYHYDHSPRDVQADVFRKFIAVAKRVRKPIIVHTRSAAEDTLRILREENAQDVGGIIHCFSEDAPFAKAALELGFISSFSGILTFKNAEPIREAARALPDDAILVETDAPFLAPLPHRGKRNEPSYVRLTLNKLAEVRGATAEHVAEQTTRNARRVFDLPVI